ncbi:putative transcriptional regulator, TetR family [Devosia sp. LC5]|uniref:TetR/AcrR family transcriptional regulator n=1 Tax=Devosia sp. LC5 TaxID=1502724 RepID=UPI0004E31B26|nr:TetR/AcrR family transcriptional regulator [Devosia sp. LC5]KFC62009.1 putative transcriptional regulator, TetR family [Devosia sp. LC5]
MTKLPVAKTEPPALRGRPRQFDSDAALVAAMRVFWRHGYAGASIGTLVAAMGVSRATLYASFGDKEDLFRKVMDLYEREKTAYMLEALDQPTGRGVAEHLLLGTIALQTNSADPKGSMGIIHSLSHAPGDESIRDFVMQRGLYWRDALIARVEQAARDGDFPSAYPPRGLALTLKAATDGLLVAAANRASETELRDIATTFLAMWPGR